MKTQPTLNEYALVHEMHNRLTKWLNAEDNIYFCKTYNHYYGKKKCIETHFKKWQAIAKNFTKYGPLTLRDITTYF